MTGRLFSRFAADFSVANTFLQFKKYFITGLSAAALEYGLFTLLTELAGMRDVIPHAISMSAGFILSFILNRQWSFKSQGNVSKQLFLSVALFLINLCISSYVIYLLVDKAGIWDKLAKLLVMGMIMLWNFVLFKKIIYK